MTRVRALTKKNGQQQVNCAETVPLPEELEQVLSQTLAVLKSEDHRQEVSNRSLLLYDTCLDNNSCDLYNVAQCDNVLCFISLFVVLSLLYADIANRYLSP